MSEFETNPELRLSITRETLQALLASPGPHPVALDGETMQKLNPACVVTGVIPGHQTGTFSAGGDCGRHAWIEIILDPGGPVEEIIVVADAGEREHGGQKKAPPHKAGER